MTGGERSRTASLSNRSHPIFAHHLSQRLSPLLDATHSRELPAALVRRHSSSLDHLHALLSGALARRLSLRTPRHNSLSRRDASADPLRSPVAIAGPDRVPLDSLGLPAHSCQALGAAGRNRSCSSHSLHTRHCHRLAIFRPLYDGSAPPGLVSAYRSNPLALPPLCCLEFWFVLCVVCVSDPLGAAPVVANAGSRLDRRLHPFCCGLLRLRLSRTYQKRRGCSR